jgi:hypothetical protein
MITYTAVNQNGYQRIARIPLYIAACKGYFFTFEGEEFYIYESDKELLNLTLN